VEGQFTYTYSQPDDYRFCQDSILFPKFVAERIGAKVTSESRILDVCAGCGVVGFELQYHLPLISQMDFLEIQDGFKEHFALNRTLVQKPHFRFINANYARLSSPHFAHQYDFIVGNPPYFAVGDGKLSNQAMNDRCRFFLDDSFESLVRGVINGLKPRGEAFLLCKSGKSHGRDILRDVRRYCGVGASANFIADIRTTQVLHLNKS
jgi:tRNA1Val (adenine37-N6)-methyltransferase